VGSYSVTASVNSPNYTGTSGAISWNIVATGSAAPSLNQGSQTVPVGTQLTFAASGDTTGAYNWGGTAGASGSGSSKTITFATASSTAYTVSVQDPGDANHAASAWTTVYITVNPIAPPAITISPTSSTIVQSQSVGFTAGSGQNGYVWSVSPSGPTGLSGSGSLQTVNFSTAGSYTVTVYSPAGGNYTASGPVQATVVVQLPYINPGLNVLVPAP
jgi:hypothetical protein